MEMHIRAISLAVHHLSGEASQEQIPMSDSRLPACPASLFTY